MEGATRKTEVTKLITVTLGKIQESKHAKCGLNLRKSLLVASVLHKARDIYVTEVKHRSIDQSSTDSDNANDTNSFVPAKIRRRYTNQRSRSIVEEEVTQSSHQNEGTASLQSKSSRRLIRPMSVNSSGDSTSCPESPSGVCDILDELASQSDVESQTSTITVNKENNPPASFTSGKLHLLTSPCIMVVQLAVTIATRPTSTR